MKGLGYFVVVLGLLLIVGAFAMDVSVSSGVGRVNNIGLMAERQNFILVGGMLAVMGLLALMLRRRTAGMAQDFSDTKTCLVCAETIKRAAVKCKHCGVDIVVSDQDIKENKTDAWSKKGDENAYVEYLILPVLLVGIIIVVIFYRISKVT